MLQVESGGKLRVRSQNGAPCGSCGSCQGPGLNCALATVLALIRTIHTTTSRQVPLASASYMIVTARRAVSPPTMPGLRVTGDGSSVAGETQAYVATPAPMIESIRTSGKVAAVAKSFTWAGSSFFVVRTASISAVSRTPHGVRLNRSASDRVVVDLSALVPQSGNLLVRRGSEVRLQ
jgi:hypothetical protein